YPAAIVLRIETAGRPPALLQVHGKKHLGEDFCEARELAAATLRRRGFELHGAAVQRELRSLGRDRMAAARLGLGDADHVRSNLTECGFRCSERRCHEQREDDAAPRFDRGPSAGEASQVWPN